MNKITIELTEDQANHIYNTLLDQVIGLERDKRLQTDKLYQAQHAFICRIIGKMQTS